MNTENIFSISGYRACCAKWVSTEIVGWETCYRPGQFICFLHHFSLKKTDSEDFGNISSTYPQRIGGWQLLPPA